MNSKMNKRSQSAQDYEVGFCKPPKEHQFKPGHIRQIKRGTREPKPLLALFKEITSEKLKMTIDGQESVTTRGEAVLFANFQKLLKSDQKAMHNMFRLLEEGNLFEAEQQQDLSTGGLQITKMTEEGKKAWVEKLRNRESRLSQES